MLASVLSCGLTGIDGFGVEVEVNLSNGMPAFEIVGLPDAAAREVQRARYAKEKGDIRCNAQLDARTIARACAMTPEAHELTLLSCERLKLSNRAYTRILKVARTIADLDGADEISAEHVSEAVQYRTLDRKYWG